MKIEKSRFWHFLSTKWNAQISIIKYNFLYCLLTMGMGGIDTDTIGHSRLGILGTNPTFVGKKVWQCDSCHTVPSSIITFDSFYNATNHLLLWQISHSNLFTLLRHSWHQKISKNNIWNSDIVTAVTVSHFIIKTECCLDLEIDAFTIRHGYFVTHVTCVGQLWHLRQLINEQK